MLIFELLNAEGPGFLQVRNQVYDFLLANEHKCVSLVSHFQKKDTKILYILDERNVLWGVISISPGGQILHCLESDVVLPVLEQYFSLFKPQKLFSIIGEKRYTEALGKIFLKQMGVVSKSSVDYMLMEYNQSVAEEVALKAKIDSKKRAFLADCEIFDCRDSDFDALYPLQKAYEIEEVITSQDTFNEKNTRILLRRSLQNNEVFAVRYNGRIIAKASINATGENCIQLGGIFTDSNFRNRGVATYLVKTVTQRFIKNKKTIVLFVKKVNSTAINVYQNCGFATFSDYKIIYF